MRITPTTDVAARDASGALGRTLAMSVEDELRDLRIDGYDVVFVQRVALLPAELVERSGATNGTASVDAGAGRG